MPLVSSYTETTLKDYLVAELATIGTALVWTTASTPVVEAMYDTEIALGVEDVADATSVPAIRALGAVAIWQRAVKALAAQVDSREGDVEGKWSQMHAAALKNLALAEAAAAPYGGGVYRVSISRVDYLHDPYTARDDSERTL